MPSVVIVGHGPSMLTEQMGKVIDQHDIIIRMKRCQDTLKQPKYYGTRTDILCGSWTIAAALKSIPANEYWAFLDSRHDHVMQNNIEAMKEHFSPYKSIIDRELCDAWNNRFRESRTPFKLHAQMVKGKSSDPTLGHNHLSAGFHTLLYAAKHLKADEIHLIGCDSLYTGKFYWSITRGPDWNGYPDHRWDIENKLIPEVAEAFGVRIGFILPEKKHARH